MNISSIILYLVPRLKDFGLIETEAVYDNISNAAEIMVMVYDGVHWQLKEF